MVRYFCTCSLRFWSGTASLIIKGIWIYHALVFALNILWLGVHTLNRVFSKIKNISGIKPIES